jgi:hypothetical protein
MASFEERLARFLPQCRWVIIDARHGYGVPHAAANDREGIVQLMRALPAADRDSFWVLDRVAQDRAPWDQPHNRDRAYGWKQ